MMGDSPLCEQQQWVVKQQPVANESAAMLIQLVIALLAPYSRWSLTPHKVHHEEWDLGANDHT